MESAAIALVVGGLVSFILERIPQVKNWLGAIPDWADAVVLAAAFYLIPLGLAYAACQGYTLAAAPATCVASYGDAATLVLNSTVALLGSQLWHTYVNKPLAIKG